MSNTPLLSDTSAVLPTERGFAAQRACGGASARRASDEEISSKHGALVANFRAGRTKDYAWRMAQLAALKRFVLEKSDDMMEGLKHDLGRPKLETFLPEVCGIISEIELFEQSLRQWMKPERVSTPGSQLPAASEIVREPKGVILIMGPWNFPVLLCVKPLVAAIAAGNCVMLKPSEFSPASERILNELPKYVDSAAVDIVLGGVPEATALLKLRWDHILYTGNGAVARIVARAAADHLTPLTLELGGKSPTLVLPGANVQVAARRILIGKFMNSGQMCVAPDYALVHKDIEAEVAAECIRVMRAWFGEDASKSESLGRIVNEGHAKRIQSLIDSAGGEATSLGKADIEGRFIPPTIIRSPTKNSAIMTEEVFGPVLPILKMDSVDSMIEHVNAGEKPLALYIFGPPSAAQDIIARTSSGSVCVNDTVFQIANPNMPFGGIGASGMGRYNGKFGFDEFSHQRAVMYRSTWMDPDMRYPPYKPEALDLFRKLIIGPLVPPGVKRAGLVLLGLAVGAAAYAAFAHFAH